MGSIIYLQTNRELLNIIYFLKKNARDYMIGLFLALRLAYFALHFQDKP